MQLPYGDSLEVQPLGEVVALENAVMFANSTIFFRCASGQLANFIVTLDPGDIPHLKLRYCMQCDTRGQLAAMLNTMAEQAEMNYEFSCDAYNIRTGEYYLKVRRKD